MGGRYGESFSVPEEHMRTHRKEEEEIYIGFGQCICRTHISKTRLFEGEGRVSTTMSKGR